MVAWTQRARIPRRAARGGALLAAGWAACSLGACGGHGAARHADAAATAAPVTVVQLGER